MPEVDDVVRTVLADTPRMTDESFTAARERVLTGKREPRRWLRISAVAVAVVLAATAWFVIPRSEPLPTARTAATVLDEAASRVTDPDLSTTQFLYARIAQQYSSREHCGDKPVISEETWVPSNKANDWLSRRHLGGRGPNGCLVRPRTADERRPYGDFKALPGGLPFNWTGQTPQHLAALPRDPVAMFQKISELQGIAMRSPGTAVLSSVFAGFSLPADLRATLLRSLKHLPGIAITQDTVTVNGRRGIAVGLPASANNGMQDDLVVDPADGSIIAHRMFEAGGDLPFFDVLSTGIAGKIGEPASLIR